MKDPPLPPARHLPLVPRPRDRELSGSYLTRIALANRSAPLTFLKLLGRTPGALPADPQTLAGRLLILNNAAFARLLIFTGLPGERLTRAVPALARPDRDDGGPPLLRSPPLQAETSDCPACILRRGGARLDTRSCPHKVACLRHRLWLHGHDAGLPLKALAPEVLRAQWRFDKLIRHRGTAPAAHAYRTARHLLTHDWQMASHTPHWYFELIERWQHRSTASSRPQAPHGVRRMPTWLLHPETVALAVVFADPAWAKRAISRPDRSHKLFYDRLFQELGLRHHIPRLRTLRSFTPLPENIHAQARFGRLISDPDWGSPDPPDRNTQPVPFIDITTDYEQTIRAARLDFFAQGARTPPERPRSPRRPAPETTRWLTKNHGEP